MDQLLDVMTLTLTQTPLAQKLSKCHVLGRPVRRVLVCGSKGAGKSHMTRAVCRKLAEMPTLAFVSIVDCRALKGSASVIHQGVLCASGVINIRKVVYSCRGGYMENMFYNLICANIFIAYYQT